MRGTDTRGTIGLLLITGYLFYISYISYLTEGGRYTIAIRGKFQDTFNDTLQLAFSTIALTLALGIVLYFVIRATLKREVKSVFILSFAVTIVINLYLILGNPLSSFEDHIDEYTNLSGLKGDPGDIYLIGKILPVNKSTKAIDLLYFELPNDLRAASPEEVETILWVECEGKVVNTYTDGAEARRIDCVLTIINKASNTMIVQTTFRGEPPPGSKSGSGDRSGSRPTEDMVKYITTLPRQ